MYTDSKLVIRARIALANNENIEIGQSEDLESVKFFFLDGKEINGIENWFTECKRKNIQDFKYSMRVYIIEESPYLKSTNEETEVVCIWPDKTTCFKVKNVISGDKICLEFYEKDFKRNIDELYDKADIVSDFKKNLAELKELAGKLGPTGPFFARRFEVAHMILDEKAKPEYETMPDYLQDLPNKLKDILFARNVSYVFGGMGSWNDDPQGFAEELGLKDDYDRLTDDLIRNRSRALVYVANNC